VARTAVLGDPRQETVWEGKRISLASTASGNRVPTARYRVTSSTLYWTTGRFGTKPRDVPLWAVRDAELHQSIPQRARRLGTITVSLQHPDYTGSPTYVLLEDVEHPHDALRLVEDAARTCRREHDAAP
jgi:hypothetical protein